MKKSPLITKPEARKGLIAFIGSAFKSADPVEPEKDTEEAPEEDPPAEDTPATPDPVEPGEEDGKEDEVAKDEAIAALTKRALTAEAENKKLKADLAAYDSDWNALLAAVPTKAASASGEKANAIIQAAVKRELLSIGVSASAMPDRTKQEAAAPVKNFAAFSSNYWASRMPAPSGKN